jgi:hypothetical protein
MNEIVDHRKTSEAIKKEEGTYKRGLVEVKKKTTKGWDLLVSWKDGSENWVALKDLKASYPVQLAQYATDNKIADEPAFAWWVPHVLNKKVAIIKKIKSKYWEKSHKYGIRIPKSIEECKMLDAENQNTYWMDAVRLEMSNVMSAFALFDGDPCELSDYKRIKGHLIFDVKLGENFRRKARYVADGSRCDVSPSVTYSTVVSRDSVRIMLLVAALNDLDVLSADVQNAFITAPIKNKYYVVAGPEFGALQGRTLIIVRALYGLKEASASFRSFMAKRLDELGFKSSVADPDVWLRPAVKENGDEYYEYILIYVDDVLAISKDPRKVLEDLRGYGDDKLKFKNDKIDVPENYLGAKLLRKKLNGIECWTMSSVDYVNAAVKTIQDRIKDTKWMLPSKALTPMDSTFVPELDVSDELDAGDVQMYQEIIGMLRWATEIGRVDILYEVSILSQYQTSPREGHMNQVLHIISYLKKNPKLTLYFNPELPRLDTSIFKSDREAFLEIYRDAEEELPFNMPQARGVNVMTVAFVDASHASNKVTRRSHSGYIIFINQAPIMWFSKRQQTVETSTYSSEYIAMKACIEGIQHLRYKLRMFGIPIGEETYVLSDNESLTKSAVNVESKLEKKHNALSYHYTRWAIAAGMIKVAWINTKENLADAFTKRLPKHVREYLFGNWTY